MWKLFKTYTDIAIPAIALLFVVFLAAIFFWVATDTLESLNKGIMPAAEGTAKQTFDLSGAKQLDLKGQVVSQ